jgi:hypothetical protein
VKQIPLGDIQKAAAVIRAELSGMPYGASANFDLGALTMSGNNGDVLQLLKNVGTELAKLKNILKSYSESHQKEQEELRQLRGLLQSMRDLASLVSGKVPTPADR